MAFKIINFNTQTNFCFLSITGKRKLMKNVQRKEPRKNVGGKSIESRM